jgi:hypothetical protein
MEIDHSLSIVAKGPQEPQKLASVFMVDLIPKDNYFHPKTK